jgi:hypothetical protein
VVALLVGITVMLVSRSKSSLFLMVPSNWIFVVGAACCFGGIAFNIFFWRCPACKHNLENNYNPKKCPWCKVTLA